jgi:hypothetical protein
MEHGTLCLEGALVLDFVDERIAIKILSKTLNFF